MKVDMIERDSIGDFEESLNYRMSALISRGKTIIDIKYSTHISRWGLETYSGMIIYK